MSVFGVAQSECRKIWTRITNTFHAVDVKVSYSCTENMKSVITVHDKKLLSENINTVPQRNCRNNNKCVWQIKEKYSKTPVLKWYIVRTDS